MDEGPRMMLIMGGQSGLRPMPLSYERTPYVAAYRDPADFEAASGMGFLGPSYAVLATTTSPLDYLDKLYTSGDNIPSFMVVFFPEEVRDAVFLDSTATSWLLLDSKGALVYASAGEKLSIPEQLSGNVSEARTVTCTHKLYQDPDLRHIGAFRGEYLDAALAWGGKKLVVVALGSQGFPASCSDEAKTAYVKTFTFPDEVLWAGQYDSPTILWVLTTGKLYAVPLVSYKFQTAWLPVSPGKLHPTPVADAEPFAVMSVSGGDALVFLLDSGSLDVRIVENKWEGIADVKEADIDLRGVEIEHGGEKPVKIMLEQPVIGDKPLLALQYPSSITVYSIDASGATSGVINASREVTYSIRSGDQVVGYTAALIHGDKAHNAATKERYGSRLGSDVFVSGIVVAAPDGRIIAVLDYEGRGG